MTETDTAPRLPAMPPDFSDLVERARRGDADAWREMVEGLQGIVWRTVGGFGLSAEDRKDVFAASFCRLFERLDTIREPKKLPGWMATTTRNESLTLIRARQRLEPRDSLGDRDAEVGSLDQGLLELELVDALHRALDRLAPACRRLLELLTAEPALTYDEIAETLEMPRGSIGPSRQRCLDRLRTSSELSAFRERSVG
jgi:RNA polymerase sigma factor (sigma-70 family)